jgi:hypothetical protein
MQGAREAGGACADDQDVGFELFALDGHGFINLSKALRFLAELLEFVRCYVLSLNSWLTITAPPPGVFS